MHPLANVMHLLADKLPGLSGRGFAFAFVLPHPFQCFCVRHISFPLPKSAVLAALTGLADTFQNLFGQLLIFRAQCKIAERGNANEPFLPVQHWDAPDLLFFH